MGAGSWDMGTFCRIGMCGFRRIILGDKAVIT